MNCLDETYIGVRIASNFYIPYFALDFDGYGSITGH